MVAILFFIRGRRFTPQQQIAVLNDIFVFAANTYKQIPKW
jgi:hypothetical protein